MYMKKIIFLTLLGTMVLVCHAQNRPLNGVVKDLNTGESLPGATIIVKGTQNGASADIDGKFTITIPNGEITLICSYIGYETVMFSVREQSEITIRLRPDMLNLDEVVVVGYGVMSKSDVTGSISKIGSEDLQKTGTVNVGEALQGRMSGVQVTSQSGEPGDEIKIKIRGVGTINNSDPIYVVDGMPTDDISYLSPNEIKSIEILKDASATAVYGSRGANGVVLVTTAKGKEGAEAIITLGAYMGVNEAWKTIDMCDATEYAKLKLMAYANDGFTIDNPATLSKSMRTEVNKLNYIIDNNYIGTDWQREIFRKSFTQNYNAGIAGGGEKSTYNLSFLYNNEEGILKNSQSQKLSFRANTEYKFKEWLKGGVSFTLLNEERTYIKKDLYAGVLTTSLRADPVTDVWNSTSGSWGADQFAQVNNNPARNVYEAQFDIGNTNRFVTNVWGEIKFWDDLTFRTQYSQEYNAFKRTTYLPEYFISTKELRNPSELYDERISKTNYVWSGFFNYKKNIGKHRISAMLGVEAQEMTSANVKSGAYDVPLDISSQYFSSAKNKTDYSVATNPDMLWRQTILSSFGRLNYNFNDRYLLTVTFRADGSSKFAADKKWGYFPSFSAGWNIYQEKFMQTVEVINRLKLRAGWGQVGNEASVLNYQYLSTMSPNQIYVFGGQLVEGRMPTTMSNSELRWETSQMSNVGIDIGLWDDKLDMTIDFFHKNTKDILVITPVPYYFGVGAPFDNAASMTNTGLEFASTYRAFAGSKSDFNLDIGFNISFIKNKVVDLGGADVIEGGKFGKLEAFTTRTEKGEEMGYFYGYRTDGIFNTQSELDNYINDKGQPLQPNAKLGDVKFVNTDGNDVIDAEDMVKLGSPLPDFTYGFNCNFNYKGFDLQLLLQGSQGNKAVNAMNLNNLNPDGIENSRTIRLDSWTAANNSDIYRMSFLDANNNISTFSDLWVEDASYLRLKNIQIGYSIPQGWLKKIHFKALRVYLSANNLLTITNYSGWDPEIGELYSNPFNRGIDMGTYPHARIYMMGLSLSF
jgi:TonB-linked SusC/RagA family outer membrane protein